jgi:two-component system sensor histidine kinase VanS
MTPTVGSHALPLHMAANLVDNAIVHNPPERGSVWVTTSVHPERVVLAVENTGEQLTPELVTRLTEPFQRATSRVRTDHAGVGLGLAIVERISRAHDGSLALTPWARPRAPRHGAAPARSANWSGDDRWSALARRTQNHGDATQASLSSW